MDKRYQGSKKAARRKSLAKRELKKKLKQTDLNWDEVKNEK